MRLARVGSIFSMPTRLLARASHAADSDFLPVQLQILENPPAPLAGYVVRATCIGLMCALAWSMFATLDVHAVASGRVQPSGRSKVVQASDPGKVTAIRVNNGVLVEAGDVLLELDPTEAKAEHQAQAAALESTEAEIARRTSQIEAIRRNEKDAAPAFLASTRLEVREREQAVLRAELTQFAAARASLEAQIAERDAQARRLRNSMEARGRLIAILRERSQMREVLVARAAGTRAAVIDALQQAESAATDQAREEGELVEVSAAIVSLRRRMEQLTGEQVAQQHQKLVEALQRREQYAQSLVKAQARQERTTIVAPVAGYVQQLAVTSFGQVVSAGQPLLVIVPVSGAIEVEALVTNKDIGFVRTGQQAIVKIDAFPFTRYGTIEGKIIRISRDAIDQREASGSTDSVSLAQGQGVSPPGTLTPRTQNLMFPVTIELERRTMPAGGAEIPLQPGMTATVEIRTDERRVIDYLLSPLREVVATAGRER